MAYPIASETLQLFTAENRQVVNIKFYGQSEDLTITEEDILSGGLSINRYSVSGSTIELGSAIAAECTLTLDNSSGKFDNVKFEGAELYIQIGVVTDDGLYRYVPFGYFTIDNAPRITQSIEISALDRLVQFDKTVKYTEVAFPLTIAELLTRICEICNITLATDTDSLTNDTYTIASAPTSADITYRQLLSWICEITGTCAYMNWSGQLVLDWYHTTADATFTIADRFSSELADQAVTISGVGIKDGESVYLSGEDNYALLIEGNELLTHDHTAVADSLFAKIGNLSYTAFSASTVPFPQIYPLDSINFIDKNGIGHFCLITDTTFTLNKAEEFEGKGETTTEAGYATANPLTRREAMIIASLEKQQNETLSKTANTLLSFNELISNALGLYVTPLIEADGSTKYYIHNMPNLTESALIFTMNSGGIAWTNTGWNDGSPVWSYGATSAGDALFRKLSAEGITVQKDGNNYNISITPSAFRIYYKNMLVTDITADQMTIPKAEFTTYASCGKIRLVPATNEGEVIGTNMIFID